MSETMIAYIEGTLVYIAEQSVIVETGGIGYEILVPQTVFGKLQSSHRLQDGKERIRLYTYLQVKEDGLSLFGFLAKDDLKIFKLLITVSGIGPKGALGILSSLTADQIRYAVLSEDAKTIAKAPGIGKKTAGKLILELKDKFKLQEILESNQLEEDFDSKQTGEEKAASDLVQQEAIQALIALGYTGTEAMKAVGQAGYTEGMTAEDLLKTSLKKMV